MVRPTPPSAQKQASSRGIVAPDSNPLSISESTGAGRVSVALAEGILRVSVEGDPPGECLVAAFRQGVAAGWITPSMPALVDLSHFIGSVDWAAVREVKTLAPWGTGPSGPTRVAYMVRNSMFGTLILATSALFVNARHRAFTNEADALAWLRN